MPLEYAYSELPLAKTLESWSPRARAPVYVVHFTQAEAAQSAQDFTSINVCTREEKAAIASALEGFKFTQPVRAGHPKWLRHGIGLHHAGLLPKYRVLVEQLAQKGLLKVICGTDTLGVGINVPIRTVLFTRLCKFDGQKTAILSARDFHQIARARRAQRLRRPRLGRRAGAGARHREPQAGRKVRARRQEGRQAQAAGEQLRQLGQETFKRLIGAPPERLMSRFQVSHGMLLNVLSRQGDGCRAMQQLIRDCHETPKAKKAHRQARLAAVPLAGRAQDHRVHSARPQTGAYLRVNVELQDDFSMDQTLSLVSARDASRCSTRRRRITRSSC